MKNTTQPNLERLPASYFSLKGRARKFGRLTDEEYEKLEKEINAKVKRRIRK